nr:hypothetical protein CFP56_64850 [Quercus suber]
MHAINILRSRFSLPSQKAASGRELMSAGFCDMSISLEQMPCQFPVPRERDRIRCTRCARSDWLYDIVTDRSHLRRPADIMAGSIRNHLKMCSDQSVATTSTSLILVALKDLGSNDTTLPYAPPGRTLVSHPKLSHSVVETGFQCLLPAIVCTYDGRINWQTNLVISTAELDLGSGKGYRELSGRYDIVHRLGRLRLNTGFE